MPTYAVTAEVMYHDLDAVMDLFRDSDEIHLIEEDDEDE